MSNKSKLTAKQKIEAASAELAQIIKDLNEDGLTPEEEKEIIKAKAAFNAFKKSLKEKKAAGGTSPSELKLPAFLPQVSVSPSGSIKYEKSFDAALHKKIRKQKTFPICTGLKLGGEVSVESKASLKLAIQGAYKTTPAQLPKNEWSSYEVTSSIAANINSTGIFSLVLTDTLELLAAKFGVAVECVFNNKQIDITNFFSGGKMTVDALALSCFLTGSLGAGETLDDIYQAIYGDSCPNLLEWAGKKYTLLQIGVTIEATDKGIVPSDPTVGIHQAGVKALTDDITAVYEDAKKMITKLKPRLIDVALMSFPTISVAYWSYQLLGEAYTYITTDKNGFEKNKDIYIDACEGVVREIMERENNDPEKLRALAKIAHDKNALKAHYQNHMKEAKNIQLIKDIYDDLHKNTEEGLNDAKDGLDQILTEVNLTYNSIYDVKDQGDKYVVYFKVLVDTDGPVVIPFVKSTLSCNNKVIDFSLQDTNDPYDHATSQVYDGYFVEFSKAKLEKALNGKSIAQSTWKLTLHADYPGRFKDIDRDFDISNDIKKYL